MIHYLGLVGISMVWYPDCDTRSANAARTPLHFCREEAIGRLDCLHGELHDQSMPIVFRDEIRRALRP